MSMWLCFHLASEPSSNLHCSYDLDLLIECDDEYWDESNSSVSFVQPHGQPSYVASWNHHLRLLQVAGYAQSQIVCSLFFLINAL